MKKKRKDNIYIPRGSQYKEEGFGNPGKPNYKSRSLFFYNPEYDQFLRRQQQLKTKRK